MESRLIQVELCNICQEPYNKLELFSGVLDYHVRLKKKVIKGNRDPFTTKDLNKSIMIKSKAKNQYVKWPSRESFLAFKVNKNKYTSIK